MLLLRRRSSVFPRGHGTGAAPFAGFPAAYQGSPVGGGVDDGGGGARADIERRRRGAGRVRTRETRFAATLVTAVNRPRRSLLVRAPMVCRTPRALAATRRNPAAFCNLLKLFVAAFPHLFFLQITLKKEKSDKREESEKIVIIEADLLRRRGAQ